MYMKYYLKIAKQTKVNKQKIVPALYNIIKNMYSETSLAKIINFNHVKLPRNIISNLII